MRIGLRKRELAGQGAAQKLTRPAGRLTKVRIGRQGKFTALIGVEAKS